MNDEYYVIAFHYPGKEKPYMYLGEISFVTRLDDPNIKVFLKKIEAWHAMVVDEDRRIHEDGYGAEVTTVPWHALNIPAQLKMAGDQADERNHTMEDIFYVIAYHDRDRIYLYLGTDGFVDSLDSLDIRIFRTKAEAELVADDPEGRIPPVPYFKKVIPAHRDFLSMCAVIGATGPLG